MTDWQNLAHLRQRIIDKQDRRLAEYAQTIEELTASVVQLENDYDTVETELRERVEADATRARRGSRVLVLQ